MNKKIFSTKKLVLTALLGAIAAILMAFGEFATPITPSFIKMDLSELPIIIGTYIMGPVEGVIIAAIKILIKLLIKPTSTAYVGELANFLLTVCYILPAALVYHFRKSKTGAALSLAAGTVFTSFFAVFMNALFIFPFYSKFYGMPIEVIVGMGTEINSHITSLWSMMWISILPFNLLKYGVVSVITFLVYKRIKRVIFGMQDMLDTAPERG